MFTTFNSDIILFYFFFIYHHLDPTYNVPFTVVVVFLPFFWFNWSMKIWSFVATEALRFYETFLAIICLPKGEENCFVFFISRLQFEKLRQFLARKLSLKIINHMRSISFVCLFFASFVHTSVIARKFCVLCWFFFWTYK